MCYYAMQICPATMMPKALWVPLRESPADPLPMTPSPLKQR